MLSQECPVACGECQGQCKTNESIYLGRCPSSCNNGYYSWNTKLACCSCGGGCYDNPQSWKDKNRQGCDWYEADPVIRCASASRFQTNDGATAGDVCCVCRGGSKKSNRSSLIEAE